MSNENARQKLDIYSIHAKLDGYRQNRTAHLERMDESRINETCVDITLKRRDNCKASTYKKERSNNSKTAIYVVNHR